MYDGLGWLEPRESAGLSPMERVIGASMGAMYGHAAASLGAATTFLWAPPVAMALAPVAGFWGAVAGAEAGARDPDAMAEMFKLVR